MRCATDDMRGGGVPGDPAVRLGDVEGQLQVGLGVVGQLVKVDQVRPVVMQ
jgi:hypothetical protein